MNSSFLMLLRTRVAGSWTGLAEVALLLAVSGGLIYHVYGIVISHAWLPTGDAVSHLLLALDAYRYLGEAPILSWFRVLTDQAPNFYYPPVVHVVAALLFLITGNTHFKMGELAVLPFLFVLVLSSWYLARRTFGPLAGLLAALLIATSPAVLFSSPALYQDVPLTAMVMACLALLEASRHFRRPCYSVAAGVALGLGLLTKQNCWIFVLPAWLMAAWGGPLRRTRSWPSRTLLLVLALGVPAAMVITYTRLLARQFLPYQYTQLWVALVGWLLALIWAAPLLQPSSSPLARARERARLTCFALALTAAVGIASYWLAHNIPIVRNSMALVTADSDLLLDHACGLLSLHPNPLPPYVARFIVYGLDLLHVFNPVPVALCALAVTFVALRKPRRCRRFLPLSICLVFALLFLAYFPFFRGGYAYPIVGLMVVLAVGVVRTHWSVSIPLTAVLLGTGILQAATAQGLPAPGWARSWTAQSPEPLMKEEWATNLSLFLFIRTTDRSNSDVDRYFAEIASQPEELQPALCIVPDNMVLGFQCYIASCGLEDGVYVAMGNHPRTAFRMERQADRPTTMTCKATPIERVPFRSVLMTAHGQIQENGSLRVSCPWLTWETPALGHLQLLNKLKIANGHYDNPKSQFFYLYKVIRQDPAPSSRNQACVHRAGKQALR